MPVVLFRKLPPSQVPVRRLHRRCLPRALPRPALEAAARQRLPPARLRDPRLVVLRWFHLEEGEGRRPLLRPARRRSLRGWLRLEALRRGSRRPPFRRLHRRWLDLLRWRARLRLQRRRRRRFGHLWSRRFRRRRCKEVLARRHPGRRCPLARASPHPVVLQLLRPHQSVQARRWLLQLPPRGLLPLPVRPPPLL